MEDDKWWLHDDMCDYEEANKRIVCSSGALPPLPPPVMPPAPGPFQQVPRLEPQPGLTFGHEPPPVARSTSLGVEGPPPLRADNRNVNSDVIDYFTGPHFVGDPRSLDRPAPLLPWPGPNEDLVQHLTEQLKKYGHWDNISDALLRFERRIPPVNSEVAGEQLITSRNGVRHRREMLKEETERVPPIAAVRPPHRVDLAMPELPTADPVRVPVKAARPPLFDASLLAPMQVTSDVASVPYQPPQHAVLSNYAPGPSPRSVEFPPPPAARDPATPRAHIATLEPLPPPSPSVFSCVNSSVAPPCAPVQDAFQSITEIRPQPASREASAARGASPNPVQSAVSCEPRPGESAIEALYRLRLGSQQPGSVPLNNSKASTEGRQEQFSHEPSPFPPRDQVPKLSQPSVDTPLPGESTIEMLYRKRMSSLQSTSSGAQTIGKPPLPPSVRF